MADARSDWRINRKLLAGVAALGLIFVLMLLYVQFAEDRPPRRTTFTRTEVWSYHAYHDAIREGRYTEQPAGYVDWLAAGKPAAWTP